MPGHVKAFIAILVVGVIGIFSAKHVLPLLQQALQKETSDAAATKGTLSIGVDNWIGYFPLCSPAMARRMRAAGYQLRCLDDKADYASRFALLGEGELDLAVATVDSYVLNGAAVNYPAAIIAVLDESKGGDAIVARKSAVSSLDALKANAGVKVAFTPASPSEHLLKSVSVHFDLPMLRQKRGAWRVEADGSSAALGLLRAGKVDVAVLWEPDVSRALADPAYVKLIGTEDTDKMIVDVLLASRRMLQERPDVLETLLVEYFETLRDYAENPATLADDVRRETRLDAEQVRAMLQGVSWATLNENGAHWFGVTPSGLPSEEGLLESIQLALGVLLQAGDFDRTPLPSDDPYTITNRQAIAKLYLAQGGVAAQGNSNTLSRSFNALDDAGWARLKEIGTLKVEPIAFARGTTQLDDDSRAVLDRVAQRLKQYPNYRIVIKGHTGTAGEAGANLALSQSRARAVADYLEATFGIDDDRIRAIGYGGSRPLAREEGESDRAYSYRLPRVEVSLAAEPY
jgi:outer membrane protein OmpA-like peptidoglycan-associated protein/ABC-type nitrate/sulfonate/bicarbonate transport system substrate-binding protein